MRRLALLTLLLLAGCGPGWPEGPNLEASRAFEAHAVLWLGEEFDGLELSSTLGALGFVYGTCETDGGLFEDGGCAPPVQVISNSVCAEPPTRLDILPRRRSLHGAALVEAYADQLRVYSGGAATTIHLDRMERAPRALRELRPVRGGELQPATIPRRVLDELAAIERDVQRGGEEAARIPRQMARSTIRDRIKLARLLRNAKPASC